MEINSINNISPIKTNENVQKGTTDTFNYNNKIEKIALDGLSALGNQKITFCGNINKIIKTGIELTQERQLLPDFLYHITTSNNYDVMKKIGKIIPHQESTTGLNGIFTFELINFLNCWGKVEDGGIPLDRKLINRIAYAGNGEIVLLKIPTRDMNPNSFKIRSQKLIFDMFNGVDLLPNPNYESRTNLMLDNFKENYWHMIKGAPLSDIEKYSNADHAIEYIFNGEIPMENVQLVGKACLQGSPIASYNTFMADIIRKLSN